MGDRAFIFHNNIKHNITWYKHKTLVQAALGKGVYGKANIALEILCFLLECESTTWSSFE